MRSTIALAAGLIALSAASALAVDGEREEAPDFYLGVGIEQDLENDETELSVSVAGSGRRRIAPDLGLYDDKLLVGVRYMLLGRRAELQRDIYGGPTLFWYDNDWGGGAIVGTHLSREVILEASYRATPDWDGEVDLSVGYGFSWPWR
ncbi:MAG: hypothetical protein U9R79_19805 [Armatimonadota bacterium]|nr:hypothetical protein [Armatimonadota bacterium]